MYDVMVVAGAVWSCPYAWKGPALDTLGREMNENKWLGERIGALKRWFVTLCDPAYMLCYFPFLFTFMRLTRLLSVPMLPGIVPMFSDVVYLSRCTFDLHSQQNTTASVPLLVPKSRVK